MVLDGPVKATLCDSAVLAEDSQHFVQVALWVTLFPGYDLAETCAARTIADHGGVGESVVWLSFFTSTNTNTPSPSTTATLSIRIQIRHPHSLCCYTRFYQLFLLVCSNDDVIWMPLQPNWQCKVEFQGCSHGLFCVEREWNSFSYLYMKSVNWQMNK